MELVRLMHKKCVASEPITSVTLLLHPLLELLFQRPLSEVVGVGVEDEGSVKTTVLPEIIPQVIMTECVELSQQHLLVR